MKNPINEHTAGKTKPLPDNNPLAELLRRGDVWQGSNHKVPIPQSHSQDWRTGYPELDQHLLNQGWPTGQLMEMCQPYSPYCEWRLWGTALARNTTQKRVIALLNPPAIPLLSGLAEFAIPADGLWIVQAQQRQDFVPSLCELLQAGCLAGILAWEPKRPLNYAELRKIHLANLDRPQVCCLFRHQQQSRHSSPAGLRLNLKLQAHTLQVHILKQKSGLQQCSVDLPLPQHWHHDQWNQASTQQPRKKVLAFPIAKHPQTNRKHSP